MEEQNFEVFDVFIDAENYVFVCVGKDFFEKCGMLFDWGFKDDNILRFADFDEDCLPNELCEFQRIAIFKALKKMIDDKYLGLIRYDKKYDNILAVLQDEGNIVEEQGVTYVRNDKIGKIGEYYFYNILCDYFGYICILNKANLTTSYNMSVFGMDALFYSNADKMLLFGESKFCNNLENGIKLIDASLEEYETRISDEFDLILSNEMLRNISKLPESIKNSTRRAYTFNDFVHIAGIESIGIPLFIMHGEDNDREEILKKLKKIKRITLAGLNVKYIVVDLPVDNKNNFINKITNKLLEKIKSHYE